MELQEFKALFAIAPDKYPFQLARRHPVIMEKILTHWEVPIEVESLFSKIVTSSANMDGNGLAQDAMLDLLNVRDAYKSWRDSQRPKASQAVLRNLTPSAAVESLKASRPPTPEVVKAMQKAFELIFIDSPAVVDHLTRHELTANQRDVDGLTCLMICSQRGAEKAAMSLIRAGGNPHMTDALGNTALHWAVIHNRRRLAEMLLYFGADPNAPNRVGATPFSLCTIKDDSALAQRLYEYGADIFTQDQAGNTPLHKAVSSGSIENSWLLLVAGAAGLARNKAGSTPREIAEKNPEILRIWDMHQISLKQTVA